MNLDIVPIAQNIARFVEEVGLSLAQLRSMFLQPSVQTISFNVDVIVSKDSWSTSADLPGLKASQITVTIKDNHLVLSTFRQLKQLQPEESYSQNERKNGKLERSIPLPEDVHHSSALAVYTNGVLTVTLKKITAVEQPEGQNIKVETL